MKTMKNMRKVLQITVLLLFAAAFLIPRGSRSHLMTGITLAGVVISLAMLLFPVLTSGIQKLQRFTRRKPHAADRDPDLETILLRQISYQITDYLQSAYPDATWEFAEEMKLPRLLNAVSALKRKGDRSGSPETPKVDPASWYSLIGKPFLVELIGNLQAKGHQKLFINEQGDVYILNGKEPEIKGRLDHFPPKPYWAELVDVLADEELEASETEKAVEITWA